MTKFLNDAIVKASKIIRKSIKENNGLPSSVTMNDNTGKSHKLNKKEYAGLFEARNVFILKNSRVPNWVTKNSIANNPLVMNYQDSATTCGPTSLSMASQMLYGNTSENAFKKACKTGDNGTSPDNLINGAKNMGYKLNIISRKSSSVKASLLLGKPVVAHIQTKPASCLGFLGDYGHYILIYDYTGNGEYKVADPTKGLKTCKFSILDRATNGRDIHYYSVSPL